MRIACLALSWSVLASSCATSGARAPSTSVPDVDDVAALPCVELGKLTAEQRALLDDDARSLLGYRDARCAYDAGDAERALTLAAKLRGPLGEAQRDFIELLVAADKGEEVEVLASQWVSTGHANARAFVVERALRTQSQKDWYIPLALHAWDRDRASSRAAPLATFLRDLAGVAGRAFVDVDDLQSAEPGALAIAQGEIFESKVAGELARVRVAAVDARWSVKDRETYGEGRRTEYYGNWTVSGPDQIVTKTESEETFTTNGRTFVADIPAYSLKWKRVVVVGEVAGAKGTGHIKSLLVLPRRAGYDVDHDYELSDLSPF